MNLSYKTFVLFCLMALRSFPVWAQTPTGDGQQIAGDFLNTGTPVVISISAPVSNQCAISILGPANQAFTQLEKPSFGAPQVVGRIRKDLPLVIAYAYDWAASADFTAYKFFMWDGTEFKQILDASSGTEGSSPVFEDLDHDGTNEMVFENEDSKYYNSPQIYKWNDKKQVFEEASDQFPGFWEPKIQAEMAKLRDWKYSSNSRGPLVYCTIIANYLRARGGDKDVKEFVALADKQLQFLMDDKKNDYLQERAVRTKKMVHQFFGGDGKLFGSSIQ